MAMRSLAASERLDHLRRAVHVLQVEVFDQLDDQPAALLNGSGKRLPPSSVAPYSLSGSRLTKSRPLGGASTSCGRFISELGVQQEQRVVVQGFEDAVGRDRGVLRVEEAGQRFVANDFPAGGADGWPFDAETAADQAFENDVGMNGDGHGDGVQRLLRMTRHSIEDDNNSQLQGLFGWPCSGCVGVGRASSTAAFERPRNAEGR